MSFSLKQFIEQAKKEKRSPEFIEATSNYAKNLQEKGYPVIFSLEHLAMLMGVQSGYLRKLIGEQKEGDSEPYKFFRYHYFRMQKKSGGYREIMSPSKELKYIQKWILENILEKHPLQDSCKGFRKGISIYHNAKPHEKADIILKVDLLKYFDTITENRIFGVFADMGYVKNLAVCLAKLTTSTHRFQYWRSIPENELTLMGYVKSSNPSILPQGAPSSPALANIVANVMDKRFSRLSEKLNFNYTRYADDLTFSIVGDGRLPSLKFIREIISEERFCVNEGKIKFYKRGVKQYVTGLTIANGVNVSKKYRKDIGSHIYYCRKFGVENHLKKITQKDERQTGILVFHDWLYGHICFIQSINKKAGAKLLSDFSKIDWFIS